ncbi:LacI family DNA-binding transcriptional regulator [Amphibacillus jilinensis]|uniref:LacI family DNA-binding transcriptional regulator n=1 Tax=Amphibacillus jilinensis TaxID=1216008 RepID=UPI000313B9C7|nr:LacI family DNA-binding transcriptional regulator [Amphibacillus jilinensis]
MKVTIKEIAQMSNVAKSTVSRYLNGGSVSKETSRKIAKVIADTGYESNLFASSLKRKKTGMIGVIFKGIQSVSVGKMLEEINDRLRKHNYYPIITIETIGNSLEQEVDNILTLAKQGVDGIILGTDQLTEKHKDAIQSIDIPVILVGQESDCIHYQKINNIKAGYIVGQYIEQMGHTRIAYLGPGDGDREVGYSRKKGVIQYFKEQGKAFDFNYFKTGYTFEAGYDQGEHVLNANPSVVIAATDRIAMGIIQYLKEKKIDIPERISIIGFGNYDFSKVVYPALTTVAFDYSHLSKLVVQDMLALINEEKLPSSDGVDLALIERQSVKRLNTL